MASTGASIAGLAQHTGSVGLAMAWRGATRATMSRSRKVRRRIHTICWSGSGWIAVVVVFNGHPAHKLCHVDAIVVRGLNDANSCGVRSGGGAGVGGRVSDWG